MNDANELGRRIDQLAAEPARDLVREYFDQQGQFAADTFETLGDNPQNEISNDDLLAVTTLDVRLKPLAVRQLLGKRFEEARRLLADVPSDMDLWDASDDVLMAAEGFWEFLRSLPGVDWVIAGKLGARKRPRSCPRFSHDADARGSLGSCLGDDPSQLERREPTRED